MSFFDKLFGKMNTVRPHVSTRNPLKNDIATNNTVPTSFTDSPIGIDAILEMMQQESAKKNLEIEDKYLEDEKYGLSPNKPVFVKGFPGMHQYLDSLYTENGESLENNRRGSMHVDGIEGPVDIFDLFLSNHKQYMTIFVCIYGNETSRKAPKGLRLKIQSWGEVDDNVHHLMAKSRLDREIQIAREQAISRIRRKREQSDIKQDNIDDSDDLEEKEPKNDAEEIVFEEITFGRYMKNETGKDEDIKWLVLTTVNGHSLLISKYGLETKQYNEQLANVSWDGCSLRNWLNSTFYNSAFTDEEKARILEELKPIPNNSCYETESQKDKIFLLSYDEVEKFLPTNFSRRCEATYHAKENGAWVSKDNGCSWWWLRSSNSKFNCGQSVNSNGYIDSLGIRVDGSGGVVRPSLWLNPGEIGQTKTI